MLQPHADVVQVSQFRKMIYLQSPHDNVNVYQSDFIKENTVALSDYVKYVYTSLEPLYEQNDLAINVLEQHTNGYLRRPTTNLLYGNTHWQHALNEIFCGVRDYYADSDNDVVYFKSWVQRHYYTFTPGWHTHPGVDAHGVLSVTDQPTATIYKDFEIINKPGQMHIAPNFGHNVRNLSLYSELRIVIAFNLVFDISATDDITNYFPIKLR